MNSSRRFDIIIGTMAAAVAVLVLSLSILFWNEDGGWFGTIARQDQFTLLAMAIAVLILTIVKSVYARYR